MTPDDTVLDAIRDFLRLTVHHRGEAEGAYDDAAAGYDAFAGVFDQTVGAGALQQLEEILVRTVPEGGAVLDVGAGTGLRTERILALTDPGRVVALDASSEMLKRARERLDDPRVELVQGSALELPFDDATFDVVCSTWLLSILDDPDAAVAEFLRVLKPTGTAVYAFLSLPDSPLGELVDTLSRVAPDHNPLTHTLAPDEQPLHDCEHASVHRFAMGFTTVVSLGRCCDVTEGSLPRPTL